MLAESELDQFLDEFFGEEENTSCTAGSENQKKHNLFIYRKGESSDELEEYALPSDGMIIRQMNPQGKGEPPYLVRICSYADRSTDPVILFCENLGRTKIPALQSDRGDSSHASFFHDV